MCSATFKVSSRSIHIGSQVRVFFDDAVKLINTSIRCVVGRSVFGQVHILSDFVDMLK
jgi:hypothetical protein